MMSEGEWDLVWKKKEAYGMFVSLKKEISCVKERLNQLEERVDRFR